MIYNDDVKILIYIAIGLGVLFLFLVGEMILRRRKQREIDLNEMAINADDPTRYDDFAPGEAVILSWSDSDDFPRWHRQKQDEVRKAMPTLARALDRMVEN